VRSYTAPVLFHFLAPHAGELRLGGESAYSGTIAFWRVGLGHRTAPLPRRLLPRDGTFASQHVGIPVAIQKIEEQSNQSDLMQRWENGRGRSMQRLRRRLARQTP
jgi:hypothetical protein